MKTNKIYLVIAIAAIIFAFAFKSGIEEHPSLVIIRTLEKPNGTGMQRSGMVVYKDGIVDEAVDLEDLSLKSLAANMKIVGDLLVKYQSQGYEIVANAGSGATNSVVFNYVLQKK